ncbi:hypothetical protein I552_4992 [Mycobacterium xenopi 3993]|nr:hypothetical protein I552_4992 [Mycobacterium xenopi 3993]
MGGTGFGHQQTVERKIKGTLKTVRAIVTRSTHIRRVSVMSWRGPTGCGFGHVYAHRLVHRSVASLTKPRLANRR